MWRKISSGLILAWLALLMVVLPVAAQQPVQDHPQPGDVIYHETFDAAFDDPDQRVANGWDTWSQSDMNKCESSPCPVHSPEYKQSNPVNAFPERVREGLGNAQQWFTVYASHFAGISTQVAVPRGAEIEVSGWASAWSTSSDNPSAETSPMQMAIGVDPKGGNDPLSPSVVWGDEINPPNLDWAQLPPAETTVGPNGRVTIFVRSAPMWPNKHNDVYVDDIHIIYQGRAVPTIEQTDPDEPATATPEAESGVSGKALAAPDPVLEGLASASVEEAAPADTGTTSLTMTRVLPLALMAMIAVTWSSKKRGSVESV